MLNILFPLLESITLINYNSTRIIADQPPSKFAKYSLSIVTTMVGLLQTISGIYLIRGVYLIRRFLREHINTTTLVIHASAYGIYLVATIFYYGTSVLYVFSNENKFVRLFQVAETFGLWANFVAQLLLCAIFWNLGTKEEAIPIAQSDEESSYATLEVETFNEEDEF